VRYDGAAAAFPEPHTHSYSHPYSHSHANADSDAYTVADAVNAHTDHANTTDHTWQQCHSW
jgi:hypothetical protein